MALGGSGKASKARPEFSKIHAVVIDKGLMGKVFTNEYKLGESSNYALNELIRSTCIVTDRTGNEGSTSEIFLTILCALAQHGLTVHDLEGKGGVDIFAPLPKQQDESNAA